MASRIARDLDAAIREMNMVSGSALTEGYRRADTWMYNVGHYKPRRSDGQTWVVQECSSDGDERVVIPPGTTRETYNRVLSWIDGYKTAMIDAAKAKP